jgi:hypothetical protein
MLNMRHMILTINNSVSIPVVLFNGSPLCHLLSSDWVIRDRVAAKVTWNDFYVVEHRVSTDFCAHPVFLSMSQQPLVGPGPPHCRGFTITLRHTTFSRTTLDEWSARCTDQYLPTHNTQNDTSVLPAGFETTIPGSEWPQTHAWYRAATGIGPFCTYWSWMLVSKGLLF